jgi:hypothetical protein
VFHMDVAYDAIVSEACCKRCSKCFVYFRRMLQVFFNLDVAYVSHICCKSMFQMFQLFHSYVVVSVFMLQVFYPDVASV